MMMMKMKNCLICVELKEKMRIVSDILMMTGACCLTLFVFLCCLCPLHAIT